MRQALPTLLCALFPFISLPAFGETETLPTVVERFASAEASETPSFQRHVVPLFGRLGCNGRACHGSFQGRGGFRLSLFGYDFKADHEALLDEESPRIDIENPADSLILTKPTDEDNHEGGLRYEVGKWEYHLIHNWLKGNAKSTDEPEKLVSLEITPAELLFGAEEEVTQLQAIAVWEDGTREDVTPLCRFTSNGDQVADVDENGLVTSKEPGDTHVVVAYDYAVVPVPVICPVTDQAGPKYPDVAAHTEVDKLVIAKLRKLGIVPSDTCTDEEFLRRVRLDMTGTLPTPEEIEAFLADPDKAKRARKVDELLASPEYAAWWTTKLCDFTGNNAQQLVNSSPMRGSESAEWYEWIYTRVNDNVPYDQLVEGIVTATSRKPEQSYLDFCKEMSSMYHDDADQGYEDRDSLHYYWARRDFRELEARAIGFAYSFMGIRIQCAQCHKHPFDQWSRDDFHQFKNLFSRVNASQRYGKNGSAKDREQYEMLVEQLGLKGLRGGEMRRKLTDLLKEGKTIPFPEVSMTNRPLTSREAEYPKFTHAKILGGDIVDIQGKTDPRQELMDWLRREDNRYFAHAFVNRVWASYFNVGIVEPADDLSLGNPPSNKPLLDYLAKGFIDSGFDMHWVHRTIANSDTYQRSWKSNDTNRLDERNFSRAVPRRLPAEVAYDALQQATASDAAIAKMHGDIKGRAIAISGADYRNNRNGSSYALSIFGRSTRDSNCDCDRSMEATLLQTVYLQNDRETLTLIETRRDGWVDQVARELNPKKAQNDDEARTLANRLSSLRKQLAQYQQKLEKLRMGKENEDQIASLEKRLKAGRARASDMQKQINAIRQQEAEKLASVDVKEYVNDAYLRTLSRYPTENELARSEQYIQDANDTVQGLKDLLWALINTKEFIVNH